jgi:CDP-diacylglycerol---glycerol-3-phosphate 3-phosphatidyltransferase
MNYVRRTNLVNHNIELGLLRHPMLLKPADLAFEGGFREIFNVHHMKWYVFDNKVIITGANLQ